MTRTRAATSAGLRSSAPLTAVPAAPGRGIGRVSEQGDDVSGQALLDRAMPRDRLGYPGRGVPVPVVPPAVPDKDTSEPLDRSDQVDPLHETTSSSTLRMPHNSPLVRSR